MKKNESLLDKILEFVFNIEGFVFIICFIIAPLMHNITEKAYVGVVIFLIGLGVLGVNYFNKKD